MNRVDVRRLLRLPLLVVALTLAAIATVGLLENHADASRKAQLQVSSMKLALTDLAGAPFKADPTVESSKAHARVLSEIRADERVLSRDLTGISRVRASSASRAAADSDLASIKSTVAGIFAITGRLSGVDNVRRIRRLQTSLTARAERLSSVLNGIDRSDAGRARLASLEGGIGTVLTMLTLVGVFMIFYLRSLQARREKEELLIASRIEASTDALTGIGNRRALIEDLTDAISSTEFDPELLLAIFDLNGFKQFNDTFGHGAGDALLARLARRLADATDPAGSAYRMGGDEFCMMGHCPAQAAEGRLARAVSALSERGNDWSIDCSYGAVWIPSEATTTNDALLVADQRMYADKTNSGLHQPTAPLRDGHVEFDGAPRSATRGRSGRRRPARGEPRSAAG
jgi:diguanylate cyclase (GGDEF)-like protein